MGNQELLARYVDELNRRQFDVLDELVGDRVEMRDGWTGDSDAISRQTYRRQIEDRVAAAPDYQVRIVDSIADDDRVLLAWGRRYTSSDEIVVERLLSAYRFAEGRITEVTGFGAFA